MPFSDYLKHILDEAEFITDKMNELEKNVFFNDEVLKRAFVRSLEVIGEAAKRLPKDFRQKHESTDWRAIAGTRDKLIHDYFGIDYDIVWDIVTNEIPKLKSQVEAILKTQESEPG